MYMSRSTHIGALLMLHWAYEHNDFLGFWACVERLLGACRHVGC